MVKLNPVRNPKDFIRNLSPDEAFLVLQKLFVEHPDLEEIICNTALKVVSNVDAEEIKNDLYGDLLSLDVEDLYARSGNGSYGYVCPHDESWGMFEEQVEPYIGEMEKYHQRGLPHLVKEYCIGIIKGLVKFGEEGMTEFSDWVEDAPWDFIPNVVDCYKKTQPDKKDIEEVMRIAEL